MDENSDQETRFEKPPVSSETVMGEDFEKSMQSEDVPPFSGEEFGGERADFGIANTSNNYYGETVGGQEDEGAKFNKDFSDAAALINSRINAVFREQGPEVVINAIENFNTEGSKNPIKELLDALGVDTPAEFQDLEDEDNALRYIETEFRANNVNAPRTMNKSVESALAAILAMKKVILEVKSANPAYNALRAQALAARQGIFEYALSQHPGRNFTDLLNELSKWQEAAEDLKEAKGGHDEETASTQAGVDGADGVDEVGENNVLDLRAQNQLKGRNNDDTDELNPEILRAA